VSLRLEEVRQKYGAATILRGVSLDVRAGEVACLLGPSGCGKTTLLRCAAGLERIAGGRIVIDCRTVADAGRGLHAPPESRQVGLMFQDYALFPHLTVFDNVAFGVRQRSNGARSRLTAALASVGLADYADCYPHVLSGGQQQRCALLRALAPDPKILLLDEPFSNLDVTLRAQVREESLAVLKASGVATLVITHDPDEAMFIGERLWIMSDGVVVQHGTPAEIYLRPATPFVAGLFGSVNRFTGVVRHGVVACPLGTFPAPHLDEGGRALVLIRPESFRLAGDGDEIAAAVVSARPIGHSTRLRLALTNGADPFDVLLPGIVLPPPGAVLSLTVDPRLVFLFDDRST
jgi:iron(III) transport system ATP-binding protein